MKIEILQSFTRRFPPPQPREDYEAGTTVEVDQESAELFIAKGHARRSDADPTPRE